MGFNHEKLMKIRSETNELISMIEKKDEDLYSYLKTFISNPINQEMRGSFDTLIYTVGFSVYPIMLSLYALMPKERIVFLCSEKSFEYGDVISKFAKNLGYQENQIIIRTSMDESDTAKMYKYMDDIIEKYSFGKVGLDITGGKKPTVAAAFSSATIFDLEIDIDILYMDYSKYENDIPVYGSEYLVKLLNPSKLFSSLEFRVLKGLFESHQYKAAVKLSHEILLNLKKIRENYDYGLEKQIELLEKTNFYGKLYELRTDFDYKSIEKYLKQDIALKYLTEKEFQGLKKLCDTGGKIESLMGKYFKSRNDDSISKVVYENLNQDIGLYYMALERYLSSKRFQSIDYSGYFIRLCSVLELAGTIIVKGSTDNLSQKISFLKMTKPKHRDYNSINLDHLTSRLHKLRILRNNSTIIHGFTPISKVDKNFEKDVLTYLGIAFNKGLKEMEKDMNYILKFRSFSQIVSKGE